MARRIPTLWWLLALFVFALAVRIHRVRWDDGHFFHPDERAIGFAVERLSFSPFQWNPRFFAYGSFPMYVMRLASSLVTLARPSLRGPTRMLPQENPVARSRNWHFAPCQAAARHVREQLH